MASSPPLLRKADPPLALPFRWEQGEHLAVVGDTGTGKSTLMVRLLSSRRFTVAVKTKRDPIAFPGKRITRVQKLNDARVDRWHLDLSSGRKIDQLRGFQQREIATLFDKVWDQGGWTVLLDEAYYIDTLLKMRSRVEAMLTQGRSMGVTIMAGIQRPVDVSRFVLSSCSHLLVFRQDGRDIQTITKAATTDLASVLSSLDRFEFAWYHRPTRRIWRGTFDLDTDGGILTGEYVD